MSESDRPIAAVVEVMGGPMDGMKIKLKKRVTNIGRLEKYSLCLDCGYKFPGGLECPNCKSSNIKIEENDIVLRDHYASRTHAHITFEGGRFWLGDSGSTSGTWLVKGESLKQITGRAVLSDGDIFLVGRTYLRLKTEYVT